MTLAVLDTARRPFVESWRSLPATGVCGPAILSHERIRFICDRAGEAMRARGWNTDELDRRRVAIDADFRAAVLRTVADRRLNEASSCPGQQVTAHPHVVRGPNTCGLIVDINSLAGLAKPPM